MLTKEANSSLNYLRAEPEPEVVKISMDIPMREFVRNPLIAFSKRLDMKGGSEVTYSKLTAEEQTSIY